MAYHSFYSIKYMVEIVIRVLRKQPNNKSYAYVTLNNASVERQEYRYRTLYSDCKGSIR